MHAYPLVIAVTIITTTTRIIITTAMTTEIILIIIIMDSSMVCMMKGTAMLNNHQNVMKGTAMRHAATVPTLMPYAQPALPNQTTPKPCWCTVLQSCSSTDR
jgi:hypothetical protein